ncbi:hypothetical protein PM8797T_27332 [Gimesia maris DSM 8797]|nr:hypothetical protein PM8797T_27332 [Gimesia maris DSM 8797]|tara:strand:+ start:33 stop:188 length:156 start_codon:yes stop_codon:yes gene_type:complete
MDVLSSGRYGFENVLSEVRMIFIVSSLYATASILNDTHRIGLLIALKNQPG